MEIPEGVSGAYFIGPRVEHKPQRIATEDEAQRVQVFLSDVQQVCARHGMTLEGLDEDGIGIFLDSADDKFCIRYRITLISAQKVEDWE